MRYLPRAALQVLAELELISHGSTQAWNSSGGGRGAETAIMPPGEVKPPHLIWRAKMHKTPPPMMDEVIRAAREELESLKRSKPSEASISIEEIVLQDGAGFDPDHVGRKYGLSSAHVCRIRTRNNLDPHTGRPELHGVDLSMAERRARVRELRKAGLSQQQIAAKLNCDQKTVSRDLRAA